jgi:Flp pilus assembly protein TadG
MTRAALAAARLGRCREGSALVEFALCVPVLVAIYFGLIAVTVGLNTDRKVELVGRTIADLASQAATMSCADVQSTVGAATAVLAPYDPTGTNVALALVSVSSGLQGTVAWSQARSITSGSGQQAAGTLPSGWTAGSTVSPIPGGFATASTSYLMTKVEKAYTPVVGSSVTGTLHLAHNLLWPVRTGTQVLWQGTTSCP